MIGSLLFIWIILNFFFKPLPVVHWSYFKNECVKVVVEGVDCDCSELPDKYEKIWVK